MSVRRLPILSVSLMTLVALPLLDAQAAPQTCELSYANCTATVQMSVFTGTPTVPCLIGHPVIRVVVNVQCGNHSAGPFETLKCGIQSGDFTFTALNFTHTVSLIDGATWEDALTDCDVLQYERHH